jgi:uncharacterized protein
MKLITLADIHHSEKNWDRLVEAVLQHKPDFVAIAGDLMPKGSGILGQFEYLPHVKTCARIIKNAGAELVLILGNDDNQLLIPEFISGEREGLWHYVADRVLKIKGYEFCGCPWIRDYPFAYKYWVAPDSEDELCVNSWQLGPPLLINGNNQIEEIPDLQSYLKGKLSIIKSLEMMASEVKNMSRSIWLIHEPPAYLGFDHCATGDKVGSPLVFKFISDYQPLITIHGHIHEAPRFNGGIWAARVGQTTSTQAGQLDDRLCYVTFELNKGKISSFSHSVYGGSHLLPIQLI